MSQIKLESLTLISFLISLIGLIQKVCPILRKWTHFYFLNKHLQLWAFVFILFLATTKSFLALLQCILVNFFIFFESVNLPLSAEHTYITTLMLKFVQTPKIKLGSLFLILTASLY